MQKALRFLGTFVVALSIMAFPVVVLAQVATEAASSPGGLGAIFSGEFGTAGIVAVLGCVATMALTLTKFLPGWGTKLNIVAAAATGIASAVGTLGPKATVIGIVLAAVGALLGYNRSASRARGESVIG